MLMVFISSFVCKIHFKEYNASFNPSANAGGADLFYTLALRVEPLKIQLGLPPRPPSPEAGPLVCCARNTSPKHSWRERALGF